MSTRVLNYRQARWNMSLLRFDFSIIYRLGKQQGLSNALSRQSNLMSKMGEEAHDLQRTTLLKPKHLHLRTTHISIPVDFSFLEKVRTTARKNSLVLDIQQCLKNRIEDSNKFKIENHLLYFEERLYQCWSVI